MSLVMDRTVARSEKNPERIDLRAPTEWTRRVEVAAKKKGLNVSSYIRMVVAERMDADNVPVPPTKDKSKER
jgi:predicted DNA binding CopG/RHH family protein